MARGLPTVTAHIPVPAPEMPLTRKRATAPAAQRPALQKAVCETCGSEYGEMKAHNFTAETAEEKYLKSAATCTEKAVYYKSCTVCGERARKPLSTAIRLDMTMARGHPTTTARIRASAREMPSTQKQRIAPAAKQRAQSRRPVNSVARSMVSRLVILISQSGLQTSRDIGMSAPAAIISRIWEYTGLENGRLYRPTSTKNGRKGTQLYDLQL